MDIAHSCFIAQYQIDQNDLAVNLDGDVGKLLTLKHQHKLTVQELITRGARLDSWMTSVYRPVQSLSILGIHSRYTASNIDLWVESVKPYYNPSYAVLAKLQSLKFSTIYKLLYRMRSTNNTVTTFKK